MKHQLRRVEQIHARLLGDLRLADRRAAEIRAERAEGAVVTRPAVEIDDEHRGAEGVGMAQDAQPRRSCRNNRQPARADANRPSAPSRGRRFETGGGEHRDRLGELAERLPAALGQRVGAALSRANQP